MLRNLKEFHYPATVAEALAILQRFDSRASVIAGGTSLGRTDDAKIEAMVDISRMGLAFLKEDKVSLRIGSTNPLQALARSRKLGVFAGGLLARAAASQPSRLLRNAMTLGGSIVLSTPWAEMPPALLTLDAKMIIAGEIEKIIPAEEFIGDSKYRVLGRSEILTEVRVPREMASWRSGYSVFARTRTDPAMVIASVALLEDRGTCAGARIVLGGITRRAIRCPAAEKKLVGKKLAPQHFAQAARAAVGGIEVVVDWRASREYRLQVAEVVMRRTLAACWSDGKEGAR
ncbi:MAG: FAD binding domain-containing protein [Candidatus Wallbacteria bacterium]|nr:FAD binding domain-containing protein [Candidatus Wallbacteria bacterium]